MNKIGQKYTKPSITSTKKEDDDEEWVLKEAAAADKKSPNTWD
jgi:hypothetical protein